jgi:hypothetical protein
LVIPWSIGIQTIFPFFVILFNLMSLPETIQMKDICPT